MKPAHHARVLKKELNDQSKTFNIKSVFRLKEFVILMVFE